MAEFRVLVWSMFVVVLLAVTLLFALDSHGSDDLSSLANSARYVAVVAFGWALCSGLDKFSVACSEARPKRRRREDD